MREIPSPGFIGVESVLDSRVESDKVVIETLTWAPFERRAKKKSERSVNGNLGVLSGFVDPTFKAVEVERLESSPKYRAKAWKVRLEAER